MENQLLVPGLPYSSVELQAMRAAGLVDHVLAGVYAPADRTAHGAQIRAAALAHHAAPHLAGRWALSGLSAVWLHAGGSPPTVLEACVEQFHRPPVHEPTLRLRLEQSDALRRPEDLTDVAGVPCTGVERTVEDLLRRGEDGDRSAARLLLPLTTPQMLVARFEARRRRPGMRRARELLEGLLAVPAQSVLAARD